MASGCVSPLCINFKNSLSKDGGVSSAGKCKKTPKGVTGKYKRGGVVACGGTWLECYAVSGVCVRCGDLVVMWPRLGGRKGGRLWVCVCACAELDGCGEDVCATFCIRLGTSVCHIGMLTFDGRLTVDL